MKTKIYMEGDKSAAICHVCKDEVTTTFARRDLPLSDGSDVVKNIMAGVCDECGAVVSTPPQSTPAIKRVIEKQKKPIEARVPSHFKDMLLIVCSALDRSEAFEGVVLRFYLSKWAEKGVPLGKIKRYSNDRVFTTTMTAKTRVSFKFSGGHEIVHKITDQTDGVKNTTELVKLITMAAYDDVVDNPSSRNRKVLEQIASAV